MKLESSLPEKPGWIFATPGFDFLLLLLALILLTGVVARESLVEVSLPPSEFRGLRMEEEKMVIVTVKQSLEGEIYFVGRKEVGKANLGDVIRKAANVRETEKVAVHCDGAIALNVEQWLTDLVTRIGLRYFRVVKSQGEGGG